jgi:hypothetical protein
MDTGKYCFGLKDTFVALEQVRERETHTHAHRDGGESRVGGGDVVAAAAAAEGADSSYWVGGA